MATGIPIWQWILSSVLLPVVIGLGGAWLVHALSLRATRQQGRLAERRKSYEKLLPALHDLVALGERSVRLELHDFQGQQEEDRERDRNDVCRERHGHAMSIVHDVVSRRELAASTRVLRALDELLVEYDRLSDEWASDAHDFLSIYERDVAASRAARDKIRAAVAREV